jgi:metal-responsive CopG/Arc/MetJ family transcriptional regulator
MISISDEFLKEVDRMARDEKRSRSELIREALRWFLGSRSGQALRGRRALRKIQSIAERDRPGWDSLAEIRKWRRPR